jgi:pyruvate ferredoxin oxidoreductase alpha subunit
MRLERRMIPGLGATYDGAIDLDAIRRAHVPVYAERAVINVDGNTAAAIPFLQWWRSPILAGFPITPATKWLEYLAQQASNGRLSIERDGRRVPTKRVKLLESEHAVADYLAGVASSCRELITGTATSSVGLDHMTESVRSLGASGLGNVILVDVCRATANYPLCIEGDTSDLFAHRDDGWIQVLCRGKQQIYDTIVQLPAVGMHRSVMTPTMPSYLGIKDSHRNGRLVVEPDREVNAFLDEQLSLRGDTPGLLDGDTSMGNCVTSAYFQGFKVAQKRRMGNALYVIERVAQAFERRFGREGIRPFELFGMSDAEVALVCLGPDAGTAIQLIERFRGELGVKVGIVVIRLVSPFPSEALARALERVSSVGVVNLAHHHGRGHLTLDVADALAEAGIQRPIDSFFCGLGGADISVDTWRQIAKVTAETAARGRTERRWHLVHEGRELEENS